MKTHLVSLEISGPTAMWTRPDTGDTPVSYPAPTFAAVKGIFESVLWSQWAEVVPTKVEICRPIVYHTYNTNYGGPLRKSRLLKDGSSYQLLAAVLINVCYRLYAEAHCRPEGYHLHGHPAAQDSGTTNGAHAYKDILERRLHRGQFFHIPFLGWKEFVPDYVGPFRPETMVCKSINVPVPSMLKTCFPNGKGSTYQPAFYQDARIVDGVLHYDK